MMFDGYSISEFRKIMKEINHKPDGKRGMFAKSTQKKRRKRKKRSGGGRC